MRILSGSTIACFIDIQEKFIPHIHEADALLKRTGILLQGLEALGIPLLFTEQVPEKLGKTVEPVCNAVDFSPFAKNCFSCADDSGFLGKLESSGRKTVLLAGIETHICVLQTAIDLLEKGYHVFIIEDCVSSRTLANKENGIGRMKQHGAIITCVETVLFELCRVAGSDTFKTISKLVK